MEEAQADVYQLICKSRGKEFGTEAQFEQILVPLKAR
jgi:hypothetical protein